MKTVLPSPSTSITPSDMPAIIVSVRRTCRAIELASDSSMRHTVKAAIMTMISVTTTIRIDRP